MMKELSVNKRVFIQNTLSGALWILAGLSNIIFMITKNQIFSTLFELLVILDIAVSASVLFYRKRENDDELSEKELNAACQKSILNMNLVFLFFVIVILLIVIFGKSILYTKIPFYEGIMMTVSVLLTFFGISQFMVGILYRQYVMAHP